MRTAAGFTPAYYPFSERPHSDTCWSLHTGPDGRVYAAACCERLGGETVTVVRYDPDADRIQDLPHVVPHAWFQTGWHGVLYDAVADPAGEAVYMVPWMVRPRLMRFRPEAGEFGSLEDLGPLTQERWLGHPVSMSLEHVGGLVFGIDGRLYYVRAVWERHEEHKSGFDRIERAWGEVVAMDVATGEREVVCRLERPDGPSHYMSRGARDREGNLYFGSVLKPPVGIFRVRVPGAGSVPDAHLPLRMWG